MHGPDFARLHKDSCSQAARFKPFSDSGRFAYVNRSPFQLVSCSLAACGMTLCIATCIAGCSTMALPWSDSSADRSVSSKSSPPLPRAGRTVLAIGQFDNPAASTLSWANTGPAMSDALRQRLALRDDLDVRSDPELAAEVQCALAAPAGQLSHELKGVRSRHRDVQFVAIGRVMEFSHTALTPTDLSAWDASRNRHQAVAAIDLTLVDLQNRRIVTTDHISGSVWADDTPIAQTYSGLSFGSYRFWQTPLGLASRDAVGRCAERIESAIPAPRDIPIRIVSQIDGRRVRLSSDSIHATKPGQVLFVCVYDTNGTQLQPVMDPQTGKALTARIESRGLYPCAWLQGEWPAGTPMQGAVLTAQLPAIPATN